MLETDASFSKSDSSPTRVLLAEDNDQARVALLALLQRRGYDVTVVNDGLAALNLLSAPNPPSLALIDWEMPRLSGVEVCSTLRKMNGDRYTYIMMLTARDAPADVRAGFAAGVDDFLSKPIDGDQLLARMHCGERILALKARDVERISELEDALTEMRQMKRLVPICMHCRRVRYGSEYWREIDAYVDEEGGELSLAVCPGCTDSHAAVDRADEVEARGSGRH